MSTNVFDPDISMRPSAAQYHIHIYDLHYDSIIDTFTLPSHEVVTSLKCTPLEISEITHQQKLLIAVGSLLQRGENFPAKGTVYVIDVIDVVPEPDRPETGKRLKVMAREDTKGAITTLMGVKGLLGTAQGLFSFVYEARVRGKKMLMFWICQVRKSCFAG